LRRVRATIVVVEKQQGLHIVCVRACVRARVRVRVALVTLSAIRLRHFVVCFAVQFVSTLSYKRHDFRKKSY
jgi:hypothetical protein